MIASGGGWGGLILNPIFITEINNKEMKSLQKKQIFSGHSRKLQRDDRWLLFPWIMSRSCINPAHLRVTRMIDQRAFTAQVDAPDGLKDQSGCESNLSFLWRAQRCFNGFPSVNLLWRGCGARTSRASPSPSTWMNDKELFLRSSRWTIPLTAEMASVLWD